MYVLIGKRELRGMEVIQIISWQFLCLFVDCSNVPMLIFILFRFILFTLLQQWKLFFCFFLNYFVHLFSSSFILQGAGVYCCSPLFLKPPCPARGRDNWESSISYIPCPCSACPRECDSNSLSLEPLKLLTFSWSSNQRSSSASALPT